MAGREHRHAVAAVSAQRESPTTDSTTSSTGWLELADRLAPGLPKALLAGDVVAMLPDGSRFIEVWYKVEHASVDDALVDWAGARQRRYGWIVGASVHLSDGQVFPLGAVRFEPLAA